MPMTCPHCGGPIRFIRALRGQETACRLCGGLFEMPDAAPPGDEDDDDAVLLEGLVNDAGVPLPVGRRPRRRRAGNGGNKSGGGMTLADLFDFGFSKFLAPYIVALLYIFAVIMAILANLFFIYSWIIAPLIAPLIGRDGGLRLAILGCLFWSFFLVGSVLCVMLVRMLLECVLKLFQIEEHLRMMGRRK